MDVPAHISSYRAGPYSAFGVAKHEALKSKDICPRLSCGASQE